MKKLEFKKGYLAVISSWENDGDYSSEVLYAFDSEEELAVLKDILPYFEKSSWEKPSGSWFGNIYEAMEEFKPFLSIWRKHETVIYTDSSEDEDDMLDGAFDYLHRLGLTGQVDGQLTRKIETWTIYKIPEDISFEKA